MGNSRRIKEASDATVRLSELYPDKKVSPVRAVY
jgi:hypothetical protein